MSIPSTMIQEVVLQLNRKPICGLAKVVGVALMLVAFSAHAGTDSTFSPIWDALYGYMTGALGKVLAMGFLLVSVVQTMILGGWSEHQGLKGVPFFSGFMGMFFSVVIYYGPDVIDNVVTATLPFAQ